MVEVLVTEKREAGEGRLPLANDPVCSESPSVGRRELLLPPGQL